MVFISYFNINNNIISGNTNTGLSLDGTNLTTFDNHISNNGDMYFNICIRTLLKLHDIYEYGVGGGIVWDSNVKDEWNEAHQKSKILGLL